MDNEVLNIYEDDIVIAQNLCSSIPDNSSRSRALANILAVKLAERYFVSNSYEVDTSTGLHSIPNVVENLDIADLYINGAYVDVRVYFNSNEISVPKIHFDLGMTPALYMFIKLEQDLSSYSVAGFLRPEYIDKQNLKDEYYYVNESSLSSLYDIESHLTGVIDTFDGSKEILYSFVDGTIEENNIAELMKILTTSANARNTLIKAFKANTVFKFVSTQNIETSGNIMPETENTEAADINKINLTENDLNEIFPENNDDTDSTYGETDFATEVTPNDLDLIDEINKNEIENSEETSDNEEQIDSLFTGEQEGVPVNKKKKTSPTLIILIIALIAAIGYLGYTKSINQDNNEEMLPNAIQNTKDENVTFAKNNKPKEVAMPNETVDVSSNVNAPTEEAASVAIPAIEQHLDASVLVANLKVDWEVPAGYASNTSAKRYLIKLGKVIQLNLKSELLLLNKPPISNRITVELKYNPNSGKFEIVGINDSSGEKTVDETILNTIKAALNYSSSSNYESFEKLQGNPVLIIHL